MRNKVIKTRNQFGQPEYQEFTDMDGVIAIGLRIAAENPDNSRAQELVTWLAGLGRKPTGEEFRSWLDSKGVQVNQVETEDYEN